MGTRIKVVRNNNPDAEGSWIVVRTVKLPAGMAFGRACHRMQSYVPSGHHIVAIQDEDRIPSPG